MSATHSLNSTASFAPVLFVAFELSSGQWKLASTTARGQRARVVSVQARNIASVLREIARAKARFGVPESAVVFSCYEAGRDGFWLDRCLHHHGINNVIVDSSSIEVNRRARRAKADGLDAVSLVGLLTRYCEGETNVWSTVSVPDPADEIKALEIEQAEQIRDDQTRHVDKVRRLMGLKGVGQTSATILVYEFFGWRQFANRREVGALAGLTPTPYQSGESNHEQGISKAGNVRVRWIMAELAWSWLHFQPKSPLSQWYQRRFGSGTSRMKRTGAVALARKLLIELWRYVEQGETPEAAEESAWEAKLKRVLTGRQPA